MPSPVQLRATATIHRLCKVVVAVVGSPNYVDLHCAVFIAVVVNIANRTAFKWLVLTP